VGAPPARSRQACDFLKDPEGKISRAASQVQHCTTAAEVTGTRFGDQFQDERRVNGRLLSCFQVAKAFDLLVEARTNFLDCRFVLEMSGHD
jgi:hypothetical protein